MEYSIVEYDMRTFWEDIASSIVIKTVDSDFEIGTNLQIGNKVYHVCAKSPSNRIIAVNELTLTDDPEDIDYESNFKCPCCGYIDYDAFELSSDEGEKDCGNCGTTLKYTRDVEITYSTSVVKKNEPIVLEG